MRRCLIVICGLAVAISLCAGASAVLTDEDFTWNPGTNTATYAFEDDTYYPLAAEAVFSFNPTTDILTLTLTNTSTVAAEHPSFLLGGFFWQFEGLPLGMAWVPLSAKLSTGHVARDARTGTWSLGEDPPEFPVPNGDVGGEWAYDDKTFAFDGETHTTNNGVYGAGYDFAGNAVFPNGESLIDPESVDGRDFLIMPDLIVSNSQMQATEKAVYIDHSVTYKWQTSTPYHADLQFAYGDPTPQGISYVRWQYGTDLSEPWYSYNDGPGGNYGGEPTPVPEPMSMVLLGLAVTGVGAGLRRRRAK